MRHNISFDFRERLVQIGHYRENRVKKQLMDFHDFKGKANVITCKSNERDEWVFKL